MNTEKKPDNVVFETETQSYNASLKAYGTNVGAPAITAIDSISWKNKNIHKVNKQIQTKYAELKKEYDKMMLQYEYNQLVYNAKFSFEPITGETYHLYRNNKEELFMSIISPNECNFDFVASFYLNADQIWEKI